MTNKKQSYETKFWGAVLRFVIDREEESKLSYPYGWYWLLSLHYLLGDSIKDLQNHLPEKHPLKSVPSLKSDSPDLEAFDNLLKAFENLLKPQIDRIRTDFKITDIKKIDFSELPFENEIDFSNFIFPIDADFSKATFSENVFFNNAVFCETADFGKTTFQKKESYCKETAKFRNTVFKKIANFRNATFWGYANFKGAKLEGRAFFQKAQFEWHAPRFYDAKFNNEITWAGITLPKFKKAPVDEYKKVGEEFKLDECDECAKCTECAERAKCVKLYKCIKHYRCSKCKALIEKNRRRRIEENQNSYENTSILLEKHRKYHDEHFFFREEMRCRRWLGKSFIKRLPHWLYQIFADYGYGVERAFAWWLGNIIAGAYVIAWMFAWVDIKYDESLSCAISASFANANPYIFFGFESSSLKACYTKLDINIPTRFAIIRAIQTIFGLAILFLLLLTIRIRFRLK